MGILAAAGPEQEWSAFLNGAALRISMVAFPVLLIVSLALLCGGPPSSSDDGTAPAADATLIGGRPWIRFFARSIDVLIGAVLFLAIGGLLGRGAELLPLLAIPLEALLLSGWGSTPGKWLFGVTVRDRSGGKLTFRQALHRSGAVTLFGCGAGLDYGLLTGVLAYRRLRRTGETYWDNLGPFRVWHEQLSPPRILIAILLAIAVLAALASASGFSLARFL